MCEPQQGEGNSASNNNNSNDNNKSLSNSHRFDALDSCYRLKFEVTS